MEKLKAELEEEKKECTRDSLQSARNAYLESMDTTRDNQEVTFTYARLCVLSGSHRNTKIGIELLNGLVLRSYKPSTCVFYVALGQFYRGDYAQCRETLSGVIKTDPHNERAATLLQLVKQTVETDGKQFAIV